MRRCDWCRKVIWPWQARRLGLFREHRTCWNRRWAGIEALYPHAMPSTIHDFLEGTASVERLEAENGLQRWTFGHE